MRILIAVLALGGAALPLVPAVAAPQTGTCLNLPASARTQTFLPTVSAVECDTGHTAEVMGIIKGSGLTAPEVFQECQGKAVRYLGGVPADGPDRATYTLPRSAELTVYVSGNRKRAYCVGFNTTPRGKVKQRSTTVQDTGLKPHVCFNIVSWTRESCVRPRAVDFPHVVWLSKSVAQPYPDDARLRARTERLCTSFARAWGYVAEAWFMPSSTQWSLGNRYAYCRAVPDQTDTGWDLAEPSLPTDVDNG